MCVFNFKFIICSCVIYTCEWGHHVPQCVCRSQRTTFRSPFSLSAVGSWEQNQVIRPLRMPFYLLSRLAGLVFSVLRQRLTVEWQDYVTTTGSICV